MKNALISPWFQSRVKKHIDAMKMKIYNLVSGLIKKKLGEPLEGVAVRHSASTLPCTESVCARSRIRLIPQVRDGKPLIGLWVQYHHRRPIGSRNLNEASPAEAVFLGIPTQNLQPNHFDEIRNEKLAGTTKWPDRPRITCLNHRATP